MVSVFLWRLDPFCSGVINRSPKGTVEMITRTRLSHFIIKLALALVLTIVATVGSGVATAQLGIAHGPAVYACTSAGGGGC